MFYKFDISSLKSYNSLVLLDKFKLFAFFYSISKFSLSLMHLTFNSFNFNFNFSISRSFAFSFKFSDEQLFKASLNSFVFILIKLFILLNSTSLFNIFYLKFCKFFDSIFSISLFCTVRSFNISIIFELLKFI